MADKSTFVDANGTYNPVYEIRFAGPISTRKTLDMLPADYGKRNKEMQKGYYLT